LYPSHLSPFPRCLPPVIISPSPLSLASQDEEEFQEILADDYVRAEFLRDRLVSKAVLFFTGEALEEEEEEEVTMIACWR